MNRCGVNNRKGRECVGQRIEMQANQQMRRSMFMFHKD